MVSKEEEFKSVSQKVAESFNKNNVSDGEKNETELIKNFIKEHPKFKEYIIKFLKDKNKELLEWGIQNQAPDEFYIYGNEFEDKKLLKLGVEKKAPNGFYEYGNYFKDKELLKLGVQNQAPDEFYMYGNKFEDKELLKWGVQNHAPDEFYMYGNKFEDKELLKWGVEKQAPHAFYRYGSKFEDKELLKHLVTKKYSNESYESAINLLSIYGELIKKFIKENKNLVLPELAKEYADIAINKSIPNNIDKIIKLINILELQKVPANEIIIPDDDKINYLQNLIIKKYKKEVKKNVSGKNIIEKIKIYYQIENSDLKDIISSDLLEEYEPKEVYNYRKQYGLKAEKGNDASEINKLFAQASENIKKILPDFKFEITKSENVEELKTNAGDMLKKFNAELNQKKLDNSQKIIEPKKDAKGQLEKIINYQSKMKSGTITIILDSEDKIRQAKLLSELSSCFQIVTGINKHYSQKYLTTDRINFVGIYDEKGSALARFTIAINPDEEKLALLSKIYKRTANTFANYVEDWLISFSQNCRIWIKKDEKVITVLDKKLKIISENETITLPINEFYDDATGHIRNGKAKGMKPLELIES